MYFYQIIVCLSVCDTAKVDQSEKNLEEFLFGTVDTAIRRNDRHGDDIPVSFFT